MIPSAYMVSSKHRVLWKTMTFLNDREPVGILTSKWERGLIKRAVDRRKLLLEHKAADEFARVFEGQVSAVKEVLGNKAKVAQAIQRYRDELEQTYRAVYMDTASSYGSWAARHLDAQMKADDPFTAPILAWLRQYAAQRVAQINDTTRGQIQGIIADGTEAGDSLQEIAHSLDDLYLDEIIPNRSLVIARTEVGNAANFASNEAAQASGVPMKKTWNTLGDEFVREAHAEADGQIVDDDEDFEVDGELLGWPGDISKGASPENVINCRCFLTFDVADE